MIKMEKGECKCCNGRCVQLNTKTGLWVVCPCCLGSGEWDEKQVKYRVTEGGE